MTAAWSVNLTSSSLTDPSSSPLYNSPRKSSIHPFLQALFQLNSPILLLPLPVLNLPGWKFLNGWEKITNSTPGFLPVPQVLKSPNALNQPEPN